MRRTCVAALTFMKSLLWHPVILCLEKQRWCSFDFLITQGTNIVHNDWAMVHLGEKVQGRGTVACVG